MESGIFYTGLLTMNPRIPFHFIRATLAAMLTLDPNTDWNYCGLI